MKNQNALRPKPQDDGIAVDRVWPNAQERSSLRIVFLTRALNYGGAERQLVTLAKGLHNRGDRVVVAVFYRGGELEPDLHRAGVPVMVLDKSGRWDALGFLWRLIKFIREEEPDVINGYLILPNLLALLLRLSFPRTRAVWGVRDSDLDLDRFDWLERVVYRGQRMLARFADLIIVNSHAGLAQACARGFPREKMIVVPNGINTEYFQADDEGGRELRVAWGVKSNEMLIGLVGRLDPMKGHPTFLRAAAALARKHDDLRFVCVGDGPLHYRKELIQRSTRLGLAERIVWARARGDMPVVYSALDVLVSSSYGEGFANVIAEAMACGVPCVVTDVGDSAWIAGEAGEVARPKDAPALEAAIERSLQRIMAGRFNSACSRQRIIDSFSVQSLIARTEAALCSSDRRLKKV